MDATRPTADVVDVIPDPRSSAVGSVTITFSEPVTGLDLSDLRLTRDGGANLLTAAQTLVMSNGGATWTLGNLLGLTGAGGSYSLRLVTAGSGVADAAGNTLTTVDPADGWTVDAVAPTADIVDVSPDPRGGAVDSVTIVFSEAVIGFGVLDLALTRDGNPTNLLTGAQTLASTDGITFTLGNLAGITGQAGAYSLTLVSGLSGISDLAGNSLGVDASDSWTVSAPASFITEVYVRGSTWLGDDVMGFRVDNIGAAATLPWINMNEIVVRYNGPASGAGVPQAGTVVLDGQRSNYTVTTVTQLDPQTFVLRLDRALGNQPTGTVGGPNGDRVGLMIPGAGAAGGNYSLLLRVLQGDAARNQELVSTSDYAFVKARLFDSASDPAGGGAQYTAFADVNGSGDISTADITAVKARLNDDLPELAAAVAFEESSITRELFGSTPIV
jgi:hypothetical protein